MEDHFSADDQGAQSASREDLRDHVRKRIEHLRARLLDSSRRNPLIQVPFRKNSSSLVRFVDELPDVLAERLSSQVSMRLAPLPPIDEDLPDENTDEFLDALEIARTTDETYLAASAALDPTDTDYAQKELDLERDLKDRLRTELGLPERQTEENLSLAEHARAHDISPDYILPLPSDAHEDGRHDDADIQTLLLPDRLDRVGRSLHDRGHAFERETGVNVLHAVFGILEWNEPGATRTPARSPLLLLEVRMERKKAPGGAEYHICGENDLGVNTTLAQTLSAQFGLELPEYTCGSVEDYFEEVADLAPSGWHWKLRREALVGVFPSSRIAMHRDLNPDTGVILDSPLIETMLSSVGGDGPNYAEVYDTDAPDIERCVPRLIMDADASQFSALVDVANSQNIAIEGPPGSGKSQTIVNLIASAMADGKRVLFVAEKLTALDVVRNRLDAAGLGEFVLPLQAGRGSRDAVFQSLEDRIGMPPPPAGSAAAHKARHEALCRRRETMQMHLDALGARLGDTGMSVHEALGQAIATAEHLDGLPREIRKLRLAHPETIDPETRQSILADARMVVDRLTGAEAIADLWRLARKAPLRIDEAEDLAQEFSALARAIEDMRSAAEEEDARPLLPADPVDSDEAKVMSALEALRSNTSADPDLAAALLDATSCEEAKRNCDARDAIAQGSEDLAALLSGPDREDADSFLAEAREFCAHHDDKIDPAGLQSHLRALEESCSTLTRKHEAAAALPARWAELACRDGATLADLRLDAEMFLRTPDEVLARRTPDDARLVPTLAHEAAATQEKIFEELEQIKRDLPRAGTHSVSEIRSAADAIEGAGLFRFFSGPYKAAWKFFRDELGGDSKSDRPAASTRLRDYAAWAERRDAYAGDTRFKTTLGTAFAGMTTDTSLLAALASFHETVGRISQGDERLRYALEAGPLDPIKAFAAEEDMPRRKIDDLAADIEEARAAAETARDELEQARAICADFHDAPCLDAEIIARAITARETIKAAEQTISEQSISDLLAPFEETNDVRAAIAVADAARDLPAPETAIDHLRTQSLDRLFESASRFFETHRGLSEEAEGLVGEIDMTNPEDKTALRLVADHREMITDAASRPEGLVEQARLLRSIAALEERGLGTLTDWVQTAEGSSSCAALPKIVEAIIARSLTDHVQAVHGAVLDAHDGSDLDRLRQEIATIDRQMTDLARNAIREDLLSRSAPPAGNGVGKVGTYTEMSLIRHELNKQRKRIGVRDLTSRAGAALADLKPCWMMSPLAVAQYLHGRFSFDLVVIDEASQMTPENALGAIMRAKQVVVVGDTKQLPPTSFFSKILDDDDEDEDSRTDSESILDMANATFTPVRQLRWHYRSRHPNLIAISNKMIYDEQLTIFPAARDNDPDLGVHLVEVEGAYRKGRNIPEAHAIVAGAIQHMRDHPERSLGIATMNKDQTELIIAEFERERARHPHVEAFIERWAEIDDGLEEFFVKNLETVQGDERDVIMISTLYGPDAETGKVYQRFGPVNSAHGHRRLNVLFSRAKEKIVTYTSMKPTDIQAEGKAYGVAMLRAWLEFSHTGRITEVQGARRETDSPFEDFVIAQIEAAGYEAVPQVGASGYRIDIGVRHPDWPYGFILAVECDGAPYHSSRSSRDRDRLRQQVLEGLGWRFHRIWSTDWFRNPRRQIEKLRAALDAALERAQAEEARRQEERAEAAERARLAVEEAIERAAQAEAELAETEQEDTGQGNLFDAPTDPAPAETSSR